MQLMSLAVLFRSYIYLFFLFFCFVLFCFFVFSFCIDIVKFIKFKKKKKIERCLHFFIILVAEVEEFVLCTLREIV